jgi:hypothetical protein
VLFIIDHDLAQLISLSSEAVRKRGQTTFLPVCELAFHFIGSCIVEKYRTEFHTPLCNGQAHEKSFSSGSWRKHSGETSAVNKVAHIIIERNINLSYLLSSHKPMAISLN